MFNVLLAAEEGAENSAILPHDLYEVFWGSIATIIVVSIIVWKAGPAIKNMWNGRIERLSGELGSAEAARQEAEALLADVEGRIANADQEKARIRSEADETKEALKQQTAERAQREAEEVRRRATADIAASQAQVAADLQAEIAALAVGAAEQIIARNLDESTQRQLIESYISGVGTSNGGDGHGRGRS
jgi:F-type H+-transporting ATPase subunit b